jgi:hypothetical protein
MYMGITRNTWNNEVSHIAVLKESLSSINPGLVVTLDCIPFYPLVLGFGGVIQ